MVDEVLNGRRVKPIKSSKTERKTAWQACKTAKTVRFSKKNEGASFFYKIGPALPVLHACHAVLYIALLGSTGFTHQPRDFVLCFQSAVRRQKFNELTWPLSNMA